MRLVIADTGPLHYLVLTGDIELLPLLFDQVLAPERVRDELSHAKTPDVVRAWIAAPPPWLQIRSVENDRDAADLTDLDPGESDAIALASATGADLLLMDDRAGVAACPPTRLRCHGHARPARSRSTVSSISPLPLRVSRRRASISDEVFSTRFWRDAR